MPATSTRWRSTTGRCRLATIEDHYFGTVGGGEPPVAAFNATPNPAQTVEAVNFDASGSSDPDGTIAKYEWDLDGNGSFETETGSEPIATRSYAAAGSYDVRLRVTDSSGNKSSTLRTVTVTNRAPDLLVHGDPRLGQQRPAGQLRRRRLQRPRRDDRQIRVGPRRQRDASRRTPARRRRRAAPTASAGSVETKLRVTDDKGATAVSTKTVTVTLVPPTASFTATPNPADTGATVSFNGSASSDPDGTIAKYEWDLDGNGTL